MIPLGSSEILGDLGEIGDSLGDLGKMRFPVFGAAGAGKNEFLCLAAPPKSNKQYSINK